MIYYGKINNSMNKIFKQHDITIVHTVNNTLKNFSDEINQIQLANSISLRSS